MLNSVRNDMLSGVFRGQYIKNDRNIADFGTKLGIQPKSLFQYYVDRIMGVLDPEALEYKPVAFIKMVQDFLEFLASK